MLSSIGALILTYNEECNINECLESIKWVDEIVVVDSFSTDNTLDLCKNYTDKIYQRKFRNFASQRNYGLDQMKSEWVLFIDADERVTEELQAEIKNTIINPKYNGYKISFKNYFLKKGWYHEYHLRLFKKSKGRFENQVHEIVKLDGDVGVLSGYINHFTYRSISQFIKKTNFYTELAAEEMYLQGKKFKISDLLIRPFWRFIKMFFIKRGYKDGIYGFVLSALYCFYGFIKYAKLWEMYLTKNK